MIQEKIFYVVEGQKFDTLEKAQEHENTINNFKKLKKKEDYVKMMLSKSVYGDIFKYDELRTRSNIDPINPPIQILIRNTDLVQEIINNLKQNKWD